jgi:hypothetical protein
MSVSWKEPVTLSPNESKVINIAPDKVGPFMTGHHTITIDGQSAEFDVLGLTALTGQVIMGDTGVPAVGATVELKGFGTFTTDADGHFSITNMPFSVCYLNVSYPGYAQQIVPVSGLTAGTTKDIGVIKLTSLSAIQFISVALPAAGTNYYVDDSIFAGFRVKNVSAQAAYAKLALTLSIAGVGSNTVSTQLLLQPGQVSDWYGSPYPLQQIAKMLGAQQLTAYVNSVAVGQVGITVGPAPSTIEVVSYYTPPQQGTVSPSAQASSGWWVIKIINKSGSGLGYKAKITVQRPSGGIIIQADASGTLQPGYSVFVGQNTQAIAFTEAGGWYWTSQVWVNGVLQDTKHASTNVNP